MEGYDPSILVGFDHAEFTRLLPGNREGGDSYFRIFLDMKIDHAGDIHSRDLVTPEDGHQVRIELLNKVDILKNGASSSPVPGFAF